MVSVMRLSWWLGKKPAVRLELPEHIGKLVSLEERVRAGY